MCRADLRNALVLSLKVETRGVSRGFLAERLGVERLPSLGTRRLPRTPRRVNKIGAPGGGDHAPSIRVAPAAAFGVLALAVAWRQSQSSLGPMELWSHEVAAIFSTDPTMPWVLAGPHYTVHPTPYEAAWAFYDYRDHCNQVGARERMLQRRRMERT